MPHEFTTTKIWASTKRLLKKLAAENDMTMVRFLDELASNAQGDKSCIGCRWLNSDTHTPASDHPELTQEWWMCCAPDAPGKNCIFLDYLVDERPKPPSWCPGYERDGNE